MEIIGRQQEIDELNALYNSGKVEFVVVYGRSGRRSFSASIGIGERLIPK